MIYKPIRIVLCGYVPRSDRTQWIPLGNSHVKQGDETGGVELPHNQEATEYSVRFGSVRWKILTEPPNLLIKKWPGIGLFSIISRKFLWISVSILPYG
eukprot:sb/3478838/